MLSQIEAIIQAQIRPQLTLHDGDIHILSFENGVLRFELLGQCSNCPAASITTEEFIRTTLAQAIPAVKDVVLMTRVNETLLDQARAILSRNRGL